MCLQRKTPPATLTSCFNRSTRQLNYHNWRLLELLISCSLSTSLAQINSISHFRHWNKLRHLLWLPLSTQLIINTSSRGESVLVAADSLAAKVSAMFLTSDLLEFACYLLILTQVLPPLVAAGSFSILNNTPSTLVVILMLLLHI